MKKIITAIFTGLLIFTFVLLPGCKNSFSPSGLPASEDGKGIVMVSLSTGRAALMPSLLDFDIYTFAFTKTGGGEEYFERSNDESFTFRLDLNEEYTLELKAYKGSVVEENLGASGVSDPFTVLAAGTVVPVTLEGSLSGEADGTFSYYIKYPLGATIEKLELYLNGSTSIDLTTGADDVVEVVISNTLPVPAGRYLLMLWLNKDGKQSDDYSGVIIYSNSTTCYGTEDDPMVFGRSDFRPYDPGERVTEWLGFDVEGPPHYIPVGELTSNFFPSLAVGTHYTVYSDADWNDWEDVLKLEPPDGGYVPGTMALTRAVPEAGDYYLSMWFWVDKGTEDVTVYWHNTGGIYGDGPPSWGTVAGSNATLAPEDFGTWKFIEGYFTLRADEEIGILARNGEDKAGLKDSTIYIRDLVFKDLTPNHFETLTTWDAFEHPDVEIDCVPSGAGDEVLNDFAPGDGFSYDNVLKIFPLGEDYLNDDGVAGSFTIGYKVPYTGTYSLSMDVWVEPTAEIVDLQWYDCSDWNRAPFIDRTDVAKGTWLNIQGDGPVNAGTWLGFLGKNYVGALSLRGATIYVKNLVLELIDNGETITILNIQSSASALPQEEIVITLQWDTDGHSLLPQAPLTVAKGEPVTINAPEGVGVCEWRIDGWVVPDETGPSFTFVSTVPGDYRISLWTGFVMGGDVVVVTVRDE